ncbi:hypothetical protein B0H16DRAFT_1454143 [Mycena metata]|uniref:Uncharacterized protein n=1 Tax=Mycena metata TaxID=1033252 RepID=A0AAD7JLS5_9AGAR|nr:hypothetical protein B0H16DRAFT_1454143 [Mycena metata]
MSLPADYRGFFDRTSVSRFSWLRYRFWKIGGPRVPELLSPLKTCTKLGCAYTLLSTTWFVHPSSSSRDPWLISVSKYYAARVRQNEFRQNFNRHNTPTQASWMFYLIGVLLYAVGFDGDDTPDVQGVNVFNLAVSQADFFLKECAETVALFRVSKQAIFLDYEEYDPHHTVEPIFVSRQPPRNFKRIAVNDAVVLDFSTNEINSPVWTDAQRVVEATLVALSRVDGALLVETDSEGKVIGVQKESVEGLLADMVDSPPERGHQADCLQGGSRSHFCRSASPTLCADEEACGRELSKWSVVRHSSSEMRACRPFP